MFQKTELVLDNQAVSNVLERVMTDGEMKRASETFKKVVDSFEREAFGEAVDYGFGSGITKQRHRSNRGAIYLPYLYVERIVSVTDDNGLPVRYTWRDFQPSRIETGLPTGTFAIVEYEWQLDVPEEVNAALADA